MIFGSMFNRWPYTDLQNLNLDWLIGVCKDIVTTWPPKFEEIETEINKKLDKALNEGTLGDILTNNGNGTYEWKPFDTAIANQIVQAVNNWLANHPEATTTVQDGAITPAKLDTELYNYYKEMGKVQVFFPKLSGGGGDYASGCIALVVTPTKTILFDTCGTNHTSEVLEYLDNLYNDSVFNNIDYIVISHYHNDHIDNLEDIITRYPHTNCVVYTPISPSGYYISSSELINNYDYVIRTATNNDCSVVIVDNDTDIVIDNLVTLNLFNSDTDSYAYYSNIHATYNNYSMVALVKIGKTNIMFPGDLSNFGEERILATKQLPRLNLYSMNHHGVNNSEDSGEQYNKDYAPFIDVINPLYTVIPADYFTSKTFCNGGLYQKLIKGFIGCEAFSNYAFVCDNTSCSILEGIELYNQGSWLTPLELFVDNSYTGTDHDGTYQKPFTLIDEAIKFAKDNRTLRYNIRVVGTATKYDPVYIRDIKNKLEISAYDNNNRPEIEGIDIQNCNFISLSSLLITGTGIAGRPTTGNSSSINVFNSNIVLNACRLDGEEMTTESNAMTVQASIVRINGGVLRNYNHGIKPGSPNIKSIVEITNLASSNITNEEFHAYGIEFRIYEGCTFTDVTQVILGSSDRPCPVFIHKNLMTSAFALLCHPVTVSEIEYLNSSHPAVILANSKIYDVLTGQEIT